MEELNTMLADLAQDGALDSSGAFTISLDRAEEKLAAYRLANPALFVLNLVAAAVSGGAPAFVVETYGTTTQFRFVPKVSYSDEELEGIFSHIVKPSIPAYLRELALALHGARVLPESPEISLRVTNDKNTRVLTVEGSNVTLARAPGRVREPHQGVTFQLAYKTETSWSALLTKRPGKSEDILQQLFHFCRYAPLRLTYNGQPRGEKVVLDEKGVFAWRHIPGQQALRVGAMVGHYPRPQAATVTRPSSMVLGLGAPKAAFAMGLLLVSRGVTFRRPAEVLGFPLACAVVSADHLEKNLSQSDLVEGAEYEELLEAVRAEVMELVLAVCANPPAALAGQGATFLRALESHFEKEKPMPLVVDTFRRRLAIEENCWHAGAQSEQMSFWRALSVQEPKQAEDFGKDLIVAVTRQASSRLARAQWQEAMLYLTDLYELKGQRPNALLAAVMILSDQADRARERLAIEYPALHLLNYMLGWSDHGDGDDPIILFLRFQRAVDRNDLETADSLASELEQAQGTAFLFLWLGWFAVFREQYQRAVGLWEKALSHIPVEERQRWSDILWPEISGKVSFLQQVSWQSRRSLEGLNFSLSRVEKLPAPAGLPTHPARWAKNLWQARKAGHNEQARELFVKSFLAGMIDPHELKLRPVDSKLNALAPFRD